MKITVFIVLIFSFYSCVSRVIRTKKELIIDETGKVREVIREVLDKPQVSVFVEKTRGGKKVREEVKIKNVKERDYRDFLKKKSIKELGELLKKENNNTFNIALILEAISFKKGNSMKFFIPFLDDERVLEKGTDFFPYNKWINGRTNEGPILEPVELRVYAAYFLYAITGFEPENTVFGNANVWLFAKNRLTQKGIKKDKLCEIWKKWWKNLQ